ncbi:preprotein translocase subunit SecA [Aureispira sp. CCB-E]|uniref:preprotein translocase subunit SecA n=1 Tax=Aureispira sp. CCB-E TaxID=3051121 RepID=UPI0028693EA8|nr:preprotein translocase subunit SecA [Aureispira sp. CCB-E]WMX15063.1 preprotein translocase subunit SecA [Aureispira sp. CCB-E]
MFGFLKKLFGDKYDRDIKTILPIVEKIKDEYAKLTSVSNDVLRNKTLEFKDRIAEHLKTIDSEIAAIQSDIDATEDVLKKQNLFAEIDTLKKERDEEIEVVLNEILPEAFAVVKETARRFAESESLEVSATDMDRELAAQQMGSPKPFVSIDGDKAIWKNSWMAAGNEVTWNMVHYDVQLIGGIVLHQGKIAEMATGEGKTLVSTLPAYLNGLAGEGVHLITVNDYLAKRDAEWMAPIHNFLQLTVDCIDKYRPHSPERKAAYRADITYGTNNEFGFDYLRDNMAHKPDEIVQRKFHFTMIDEVDSVLIDDARTPLIISGPTAQDNREELFTALKPAVQQLEAVQRKLVGELLREAKRLIAEGNTSPEEGGGGLALFRAYRGLPKHRALIKYLSEPGVMLIMQKTENFYMAEQSKHMPKADAPLYFVIEEKNRSVELTDNGRMLLGKGAGDDSLFVMDDIGTILSDIDKIEGLSQEEIVAKKDEALLAFQAKNERLHALRQLLKAYTLFHREDEYVVMNNEVKIVDEQTGRIMDGRRFSDGLHQALEAKESVKIEKTTQTYATITLQNFFRMYHKLAGMTGTAETEAQELWNIYKLDVVVIPTNRPIVRDDRNDLVYKTEREKINAIINDVVELTKKGQPVLVGTTSVQQSEMLSRLLQLRKIEHNVLNAKQHAREADVVAEAGKAGQVTIATNMAGRGTDIKISDEVKKAGGLAIIGTERHDSRRVDRQLRGRAGRQGDVGMSQFYVSLEDKLMRLFGSERISKLMDTMGHQEGEALQHKMITNAIERAQKRIEENNFGVRKRLLEYDDVMNIQRESIYKKRNNALYGERLAIDLNDMFDQVAVSLVTTHKVNNDYNAFAQDVIRYYGFETNITENEFRSETVLDKLMDKLYNQAARTYKAKFSDIAQRLMPIINRVYNDPNTNYQKIGIPFTDGTKGMEIGADLKAAISTNGKSLVNDIEKSITLGLIDNAWKEHLRDLDELKDQTQSASFEQKDPLVVYKIQASKLYELFLDRISKEITSFLFKGGIPIQESEDVHEAQEVEVDNENLQTNIEAQKEAEEMQRRAAQNANNATQTIEKVKTFKRDTEKIKRNDPCPCGSGKKYKQCHGKK